MPESLHILWGAAFTILACGACGYAVLAWMRISCSRVEAWPMSLLVGAALFSTLILALGLVGGARRPVLVTAGLLAIALPLFAPALIVGRSPRSPLVWVASFAFGLVYFVHAWAPEISPDGMAYHVALPAHYLRQGRIGFIPTNIYAQLSQAMEMLYLPAFALGRHSAPALVHLSFLFALLGLMRAYAVRAGVPQSAALLVLASPVVGIDAASAYNDVALAAVLFALFWMMERWREEQCDRLLWIAGLMAGLAFALKYTAFLAVPYALLMLGRRVTLPRAAKLIAAASLVVAPWLLKNWFFAGNPIAPFANGWFPNEVFDPGLEATYRYYLGFHPDQPRLSQIPYAVTTGGFALGGLVGPVFLLAPLIFFSRWRLALPALLFIAPFGANLSARFLIPGLPFVALAMAMVLSRVRGLWLTVAMLHLVLGWYPITHAFADTYAWHIKEFPWRAALRLESEAAFMGRKVAEYPIFAAVQGVAPGRVLTYAQFADSYTGTEMITGSLSRRGVEMGEMLWNAAAIRHAREGTRFWFPQQRLRGLRVLEVGAPTLMVSEFHAFHLMDEINLQGATAKTLPASSEARFTLDGNPMTRWRGDQDTHRLASLEVTWAKLTWASRIVLEDMPPVPVRLAGLGEDGQWRELAVQAERTWFAPGDYRRDTTHALRQQGVDWLLLGKTDAILAEMLAHPAAWGLRLVAQGGGQWLFRIE